MTPDEFYKRMADIYGDSDYYDIEEGHLRADELICDVLKSLGYEKGIELFENADKWYA